MRIALLQIKSSENYKDNFEKAKRLLREIRKTDIVVLPESFLFPYGTEAMLRPTEIFRMIEELAAEVPGILIAGTVPEQTVDGTYNTVYVFNDFGKELLGKYRKVHLYDVGLPGVNVKESDNYLPGEDLGIIETPFGKIGIAVCFDIRFPELFTRYAQEDVRLIIVPAAFSVKTGPVHWKVLNQARALDSQCFIAGCTQAYNTDLPFPVYGGSLVTDPYGKVIAEVDGDEQIIYCDFDLSYADIVRKKLPVLAARKENVYHS